MCVCSLARSQTQFIPFIPLYFTHIYFTCFSIYCATRARTMGERQRESENDEKMDLLKAYQVTTNDGRWEMQLWESRPRWRLRQMHFCLSSSEDPNIVMQTASTNMHLQKWEDDPYGTVQNGSKMHRHSNLSDSSKHQLQLIEIFVNVEKSSTLRCDSAEVPMIQRETIGATATHFETRRCISHEMKTFSIAIRHEFMLLHWAMIMSALH